MNYLDPIRALMPGIDGAVLSVLARSSGPQTLRQIAERAGASHPQVAHHVERFEKLGMVTRQVVGRSHLVLLSNSAASQWVRELAGLRGHVLDAMRREAHRLSPSPATLTVFGSFARGMADEDSDIDVLVVAPTSLTGDQRWLDDLARWVDGVAVLAGNPVSEMVWALEELAEKRDEPLREVIVSEGVVLVGQPLDALLAGDPVEVHHDA